MSQDRRSDKHSPRVDEELDHETDPITRGSPVEARAEEEHEKEPPSTEEPTPDARLRGDREPNDDGHLDVDEREGRADLARWLQPSAFPADRARLLESARETEAPESVLGELARLPDGVEFANVQAVWAELGGDTEERF